MKLDFYNISFFKSYDIYITHTKNLFTSFLFHFKDVFVVDLDKRTVKRANPSVPHCPGWSKATRELSALITDVSPPQQLLYQLFFRRLICHIFTYGGITWRPVRLAGTEEKWSPGVTLKSRRQRDLSFYDIFVETQAFVTYFDNPTAIMTTDEYPLDVWYSVYKQLQQDTQPLCISLKSLEQPDLEKHRPLIEFSSLPLKEPRISSEYSFITVHDEMEYERIVNSPDFSADSQFILSPPLQTFDWDLFMKQLPKESERMSEKINQQDISKIDKGKDTSPDSVADKQKGTEDPPSGESLLLPPIKGGFNRNRSTATFKRASLIFPNECVSNFLPSASPGQNKRVESSEKDGANKFSREEIDATTDFPIPLLVMVSQCMNGGPSVHVTPEEYAQLAEYCKNALDADTPHSEIGKQKDELNSDKGADFDLDETEDEDADNENFGTLFQDVDSAMTSRTSGIVTFSRRYLAASLLLPVLTTVVRNDGSAEIPLAAACRGLSIWQDERMWEECLIIRMSKKIIELYGENYMEKAKEFRVSKEKSIKHESGKDNESFDKCPSPENEEKKEKGSAAIAKSKHIKPQLHSDEKEQQPSTTRDSSANESMRDEPSQKIVIDNSESAIGSTDELFAKFSDEEEGNALTEISLLLHAMVDLGASPKIVRRFLFSAEQITGVNQETSEMLESIAQSMIKLGEMEEEEAIETKDSLLQQIQQLGKMTVETSFRAPRRREKEVCRKVLSGVHRGPVLSVLVNGVVTFTASCDRSVGVWDTRTATCSGILEGHKGFYFYFELTLI